MPRKSKIDWLDQGLLILGEYGTKGLTIEQLCKDLNLTKGSFYHHFEHVNDFNDQLLDHWASQYDNPSGNLPNDPEGLLSFLDMLMKDVYQGITQPEVAIRSMTVHNDKARRLVEKIDQQRYEFLLLVFRSTVEDEAQALILADTLMTITIGSMAVYPQMKSERVYELYKEFMMRYLGR